jgi:hypothetical protein
LKKLEFGGAAPVRGDFGRVRLSNRQSRTGSDGLNGMKALEILKKRGRAELRAIYFQIIRGQPGAPASMGSRLLARPNMSRF